MSKSEKINLEDFGVPINPEKLSQWRKTDNPENITDEFAVHVLQAYFSKRRELFIQDSVEVIDKRIEGDSQQNHIKEEELLSGRGKATIRNQDVEFDFEIYCVRRAGGFVYDVVNVKVSNFQD